MEIRQRESIRIPDDLYDRIESMATERRETVHDVAEQAIRFWVSITSEGEASETRVSLSADQERLVSYFLRFLRRAAHDEVAAVQHVIEGWRKRDAVT